MMMSSLCGRSWAALEASVSGLELLTRPLWAVLGSSWALSGRSWVALGASWGCPGLLLRPLWAVLACLRSLLGRGLGVMAGKVALSRAGLRSGTRIKAEKWPKPEREGRLEEGTPTHYFRCPNPPVDFFL